MPRNVLLFLLVALAQLAVPVWMIIGHERIRSKGEIFQFRTAPVDPRDPFRGEYVRLDFEAERGPWLLPDRPRFWPHPPYYASLTIDSGGFARIKELNLSVPSGMPYLKVRVTSDDSNEAHWIDLPFDRYYLEEGDGKKTEEMLAPQWSDGAVSQPLPAHAVVRILNGEAVITDLVVGDKSIHEWLKDVPRSTPVTDPIPVPVAAPDLEPTSEPAGS